MKQKETLLNIRLNGDKIELSDTLIDEIGDNHVSTSVDTPMRADAFDKTEEEKLAKELALIDFDEALYFYRRNPLIDKVGQQLGIINYQMTKFFETNDWHKLVS